MVDQDAYEILRLLILFVLIGGSIGGVIWISTRPIDPAVSTKDLADALKSMQGLSPAIQACYTIRSTTSSIIIAAGFGISLGSTYLFGDFLYRKFRESVVEERERFWTGVAGSLKMAKGAELSEIVLGFNHYEQIILDRRNLYWSLFLRATLALLVVAVIALLISVCKIEAQAGLPIITGIIAFIIGQHSDILHGSGPPISGATRPAASTETQAAPDQATGGGNAAASASDQKQSPTG